MVDGTFNGGAVVEGAGGLVAETYKKYTYSLRKTL